MDPAWLLILGVLLLVAGLCVVAFATLRDGTQPCGLANTTTNLLKATAHLRSPRQRSAHAPVQQASSSARGHLFQGSLPSLRHGARKAYHGLKGSMPYPRWALPVGIIVLALASACVAVFAVRAEPASAPPGSEVLGICPFAGAPANSPQASNFADFVLKSAAGSNINSMIVRISKSTPTTAEAAEKERARLGADFLLWGEQGADGTTTATLTLDPRFAPGVPRWQQFTQPRWAMLALPNLNRVRIPAGTGLDPLVPLTLSLAHLKHGDYAEAARAAYGAAATLEQVNNGAPATLPRLVEAVAHILNGNPKEAEGLLAPLDANSVPLPEVASDRAAGMLETGDNSGAISEAERVLGSEHAPDQIYARAYLQRGIAYGRTGEEQRALTDLGESINLDPSGWLARLQRAQLLYSSSQPDAARQDLQVLLHAVPDCAPAYTLSGLIGLMLAQPEEAQRSLAQAESLYRGWIAPLRAEEGRAQVTGDVSAGERATGGILSLNGALAGVLLYQGMAWADVARKQPPESFLGGIWRHIRNEPTAWERAIAKMSEAAILDSRRADIPLQIGNAYTSMGDFQSAATALSQAQELAPTAPESYLALAHLQQTQGKTADAAATLNSLITHVPRLYSAYNDLYKLYSTTGDKAAAGATLERALRIDPQNSTDHLWRGKFFTLLGDKASAAPELQASGADPAQWEAHLLLGKLLQEQGQTSSALAEFQQALTTQPNNPDAMLGAARALVSLGRGTEAQGILARL
ncbi:MAG: tetratricopeptide repeat protein, partial [Chloroflexota bacterium]|nr:tetratricopeptide repeat protein [Chloroflexota bacterium]